MRRLRHFGNGLVAEIMETQAADWRGGGFSGCDGAAETFPGFERLLRCLYANPPGGLADQFASRGAPLFCGREGSMIRSSQAGKT